MPVTSPHVSDVLTEQQRLVTARCVHMVRELMGSGYPVVVDDGQGFLAELDRLEAVFLGSDLKLLPEGE